MPASRNSLPISIHPIDSKPFGLSYGEWTEKWWKWLLSIPKKMNPSIDLTGLYANENQNDPNVFFLCQTIEGTNSTPIRVTKLPSGKDVLIPVMNWISILHENGETDEELIKSAKDRMDVIKELSITINGIELDLNLRNYRAKSTVFDFHLPAENVLDLPSGYTRLVSDGYWILFHPLGYIDEMSTFSTCSSGATRISAGYHLKR